MQAEVPDAPFPHALELLRWQGMGLSLAAGQGGASGCRNRQLARAQARGLERRREGAGLKATLGSSWPHLEDLVNVLRAVQDGLQQQLWAKLRQRAEAAASTSRRSAWPRSWHCCPKRPIFCEELDRLVTHRAAFLASLQKPGAQGISAWIFWPELAREAEHLRRED